jgi:hypothetical protein
MGMAGNAFAQQFDGRHGGRVAGHDQRLGALGDRKRAMASERSATTSSGLSP